MKVIQIIILLVLIAVLPATATIHHVPGGYPQIQTAIDACNWGDTVLVAPGTYHELLQIPTTELTLASNFILTQDTTDISMTILDGEYQGTIIEVLPVGSGPTDEDRIFCLNGFTVQHGQGWYSGGFQGGGAIQAIDSSNVVLENCVFTENEAPRDGAVLNMGVYGNVGSLVLRNIRVFGNNQNPLPNARYAIYAPVFGKVEIDGLYLSGLEEEAYIFEGGGLDTTIVRDLVIEHFANDYGEVIEMSTHNYMYLENIYLRNNSASSRMLLLDGVVDSATVRIKNLWVTDNSPARFPVHVRSDLIYADSLFFLRNRGGFRTVCAVFNPDLFGQINHLVVQENAGGVFGYEESDIGGIITVNCSINDGLFLNDTLYLHDDPDSLDGVTGRTVLFHSPCSNDHPSILENCRFIGNFHDDPDDYSNPEINPAGSQGRVLLMYPTSYKNIVLRHCLFENNRQPNLAPDCPTPWGGSHGVGSIIHYNSSPNSIFDNLTLEDVVLRDNDDGGILIEYGFDVTLRNLQVVNIPRRGIDIFGSNNVLMENVLISGVIEQENYWTYPYTECTHNALSLITSVSATVRNTTITGCDLPYLFSLGTQNAALPEFHNCIIAGNNYDYFRRPDPEGNDNSVYAEYSYIQQEVEGADNVIGNDPMFHSELGYPYLDSASPCIDAGNPGFEFLDPPDPNDPAWPLWPAQGTRRNDIGFTGGPWAMVQEFENVPGGRAIRESPLPHSIELHQNFPNPFNPTTTIEFTLPYPQEVQLIVCNTLGQRVAVIADGMYQAGMHRVAFDATVGAGPRACPLASGVYFYQLRVGPQVETKKMLLVK